MAELTRSREFRIFLLIGVPGGLWLLLSGYDLWVLWQWLNGQQPIIRGLGVLIGLAYQVAIFVGLFLVSLAIVARFILPARTEYERWRVFGRLLDYVFGQHGPAVFVRDGQLVAARTERLRYGPGIALVDAASALALEYESPPYAYLRPRRFRRRRVVPRLRQGTSTRLWRLEKQFRKRQDAGQLLARPLYLWRWFRIYTWRFIHRSGFMRWLAESQGYSIRWLQTARVEGPGIVFIEPGETLRETLDLRRQFRMRQARALTRDGLEVDGRVTVIFRLAGGEAAAHTPRTHPAFVFDRDNAFQAVYGSPINSRPPDGADLGEVKHWADLPAFVACDIFRDLMATYTLDSLFHPTTEGSAPIQTARQTFRQRLQAEPVLRQRGIEILVANFNLSLPEPVQKQRLESWQVEWKRQAIEAKAGGDLEAQRIISRARAEAQANLVTEMANALQSTAPSTAVAFQLFQMIEATSTDPAIRQLLSAETMSILTQWMRLVHIDPERRNP